VADRILAHSYDPGQRSLGAEGLRRGIRRDMTTKAATSPDDGKPGSSPTPPYPTANTRT
jgi:hypothetical protein